MMERIEKITVCIMILITVVFILTLGMSQVLAMDGSNENEPDPEVSARTETTETTGKPETTESDAALRMAADRAPEGTNLPLVSATPTMTTAPEVSGSPAGPGSASNGGAAGDFLTEDGEKKIPYLKASAAIGLPETFIQELTIGKAVQPDGTVTPFGGEEEVAKDGAFFLSVKYKIPESVAVPSGASGPMQTGQPYTFLVEGKCIGSQNFTIMMEGDDGTPKKAAQGTASATGTPGKTRITLTFLESKILEKDTEGYFYVGLSFDKNQLGNEGKQKFELLALGKSASAMLNFKFDQLKLTMQVDKQGEIELNDADLTKSKVKWTVQIRPELQNADLPGSSKLLSCQIIDKLTDERLVFDGSGTVQLKDQAGTDVSADIQFITGSKEVSCTFRDVMDIGPDSVFTLTFYTQINPLAEHFFDDKGKAVLKNKASCKFSCPQYAKVSDVTSPNFGKTEVVTSGVPVTSKESNLVEKELVSCQLDKKGSMLNGQTMRWSVDLTNSLGLEKPKIVDTLPADTLVNVGTIKLSNGSGSGSSIRSKTEQSGVRPYYELEKTKEAPNAYQEVLTIYLADDHRKEKQTITYETTFHTEWSNRHAGENVVNEADFTGGPGPGVHISKRALVELNSQLMGKSGVYDPKTHEITWTIQIKNTGNSLKGISLIDTIPKNQEYVTGSLIAEDSNQKDNYASAYSKDGEGRDTLTLTFRDFLAVWKPITYRTRLTDSENTVWAMNHGKVQYKNDVVLRASGLPKDQMQIKGTADVESEVLRKEYKGYNFNEKVVTWEAAVNKNQMKLTNPVFTDQLPAGWMFAPDVAPDGSENWVTVKQNGVPVTIDRGALTLNNTPSGASLRLKLPDMAEGDAPYTLSYGTCITDNGKLSTNQDLTAENTACLTADEMPSGGESVTVSKLVPGTSIIEKTGNKGHLADGYLTWKILVNKNLSNLHAPSGYSSIVVEDILQEGLEPRMDLIKVYQLALTDSGEIQSMNLLAGTSYHVSYDRQKRSLQIDFLTAAIRDAYLIEVVTDVLAEAKYTNTAHYLGISSGVEEAQSGAIEVKFSGGFTRPAYGKVKVKITDQEGNPLPGASVTLKKPGSADILETAVSDADGMIEYQLRTGDYVFEEIKAPSGYRLPIIFISNVTVKKDQEKEIIFTHEKLPQSSAAPGGGASDSTLQEPEKTPRPTPTPHQTGKPEESKRPKPTVAPEQKPPSVNVWKNWKGRVESVPSKHTEADKKQNSAAHSSGNPQSSKPEEDPGVGIDEDGNPTGPGEAGKQANVRSKKGAKGSSPVPKTGDQTHTVVYAALFFGSLAVLVIMSILYRKQKNKRDG